MATISGTVKDSNANFAARLVRAYRRSDGAFAGQTVSNATTGAYSITTLDDTAHFAVVHDGAVGDYDPYWDNVVLAMHMDSATLPDVKGNTVTIGGNAALSSTQSKFGGYSAYFDGSGDYLAITASSAFVLGTADFTAECWIYPGTQVNSCPTIFGNSGWTTNKWQLEYSRSGYTNKFMLLSYNYSSSVTPLILTSNTYAPGAWYHVELVRSGSTFYLFINGVLAGTGTSTVSLSAATTDAIYVGASGSSADYFAGYIDEVRITKGIARHTANFTPPTAAFLHGISPGSPTENALILDNITPL